MRICYFGDGGSIHIVRWCEHFVALGHEVHLISFKEVSIPSVKVHFVDTGSIAQAGGNWKVLLKFRDVKKILKKIKPDVFHAMYATSYGITGALCNYHPYAISTLGTDVLISPRQSKIYKFLLRYAFKKADWINTLAPHMSDAVKEIGADMNKVEIVPFGINMKLFNAKNRTENNSKFVISSTRNFELIYNIPHLLKAIALVQDQIPNLEIRLGGAGSLRSELEQMVKDLKIRNLSFTGKISQQELVTLLQESNIFISVSLSDGNNLSLVEAMSCGAYCIATDIPANRLWIEDNKNGMLVAIDDVKGLADKILLAYQNYHQLQNDAKELSIKKINELGNWEVNMKRVEEKYKALQKK